MRKRARERPVGLHPKIAPEDAQVGGSPPDDFHKLFSQSFQSVQVQVRQEKNPVTVECPGEVGKSEVHFPGLHHEGVSSSLSVDSQEPENGPHENMVIESVLEV